MAGGARHVPPWRAAALLLVVFLATAGSGLLVAAATTEPPRPPQPPAEAAPPKLIPPAPDTAPDPGAEPAALEHSTPVRVKIRKIGVDANVMKLGIDDAGAVEVPPLDEAEQAGWYEHGVTPGEAGNALIIGHVDSYKIGPAVFFDLGRLRPGDTIDVVREDGSVAQFRVDGVMKVPKDELPLDLVYGPNDQAGLRLVTCGGQFDKKKREYPANIIVLATLVP